MIKISLMDFEDGRYERKFFISDLSTNEIEKIIKFSSYFFSETFYKRDVNNLYLDSFDLDSYSDNLVGNNQRMKIRIRWYGKMFEPAKNPVLEIKIKNNHLGKKMQFNLEPFRLDKNFSREYLQKEIFAKSNLPSWLIEDLKLLKPSLLNSYKRKYFISKNKKFRITLDDDLVFISVNCKNNSFKHKIIDKQNAILEIKYDQKNDSEIANITQHFPFRLTKSSKYIYGLNLLEE